MCQILRSPYTDSSPRATTAAIRTRSNRSLTTPPTSSSSTWGIVIEKPTIANAVGASEIS
jgi:hypothetical protein